MDRGNFEKKKETNKPQLTQGYKTVQGCEGHMADCFSNRIREWMPAGAILFDDTVGHGSPEALDGPIYGAYE